MNSQYTHTSFIILSSILCFGGLTYASESQDFILIDSEFSGSQSLGQNENEDFEEAQLLDIQRMGESQDFIESYSYCGNKQKEETEKCDGSDFNGQTCQSFGFISGNLTCTSLCQNISIQNCISTTSTPVPITVISGGNNNESNNSGSGGSNAIIVAGLGETKTTNISNKNNEPIHNSFQETPSPIPTPTQIPLHTNKPLTTVKPPIIKTEEVQPIEEEIIINNNTQNIRGSIINIQNNNEKIIKNNQENNKTNELEKIETVEKASNIPMYNENSEYENFKNASLEIEKKSEQIIETSNNILPCWIWTLLAFLLGFFTRHIIGYFFEKKR